MEALRAVLQVFSRLGVPHVISGSLATNAYGELQSTKDADIIVHADWKTIGSIMDLLAGDFEVDRHMRWEGVTGTSRFVMKHRESRFIVELFLLTDDAFDQSRFSRRAAHDYHGVPTFLLTAEDIVVQKALWSLKGRNPKHRADIKGVIAVQGAGLDWDYIHRWADVHGTRALLQDIRDEVDRERSAG